MFFTNLLEANMRTKNFRFNINYYPKTESTNKDIWELFDQTKSNNLFVITDNQIAGKGRNNNTWLSVPNKSITCSFLLKQIFNKMNFHALIIPLSIINGVKKFTGIELKIKWPNDIVYKNKKLAGILIESIKYKAEYLFNIGIGINVNEEIVDLPENLKQKAISLKLIKNKSIQREPLLASIFNELDYLINNANDNYIANQWLKNCSHINQNVEFKYKGQYTTGMFKTINDKGQAVIKCNSKEIEFDGAIQLL